MGKKLLIIGAGGVSQVTTWKCAMLPEVFTEITLASRTKSKCDQIAALLPRPINTAQVDADNLAETVALINQVKPDLVINLALPYQDLHLMEACLATGVNYLDTANYEPPETAKFEYGWQWNYQKRFRDKGIMALLGSGFDPGVTSVMTMYALKHYFDEIHHIDIIDCNAGSHGMPFATNFNPEINIREVTAKGRYWENGEWVETAPLSVKQAYTMPENLGSLDIYLMYHEELESLARFVPGLKRARFWMSFSDNYLKHLEVLQNVGMTGIEPVAFQGQQIVPLQFLKALLPDPASLGPKTTGHTCIGVEVEGVKDGKFRKYFIYNICDHQSCYAEVKSQAISYTAGVPAMIGAKQMVTGKWQGQGVFNVEQLDPDPFMEDLNHHGLPWKEVFVAGF
ncbi:MAG: saccharopine dehydrogenase family protein [Desulfuromonadales bacterium]|nr:saccharopine dehydrogenase family protein [Desulfuromonadales bacterium]MDT8422751.1 saccharopine dehydrogenase family protein [Desulfuromonadales bacterium]